MCLTVPLVEFFLLQRAVSAHILSLKAVRLTATVSPEQLGAERESKVVKAVGDDHVIVEADQGVDDGRSKAES